ncbi:DUF1848 domain-containing protein [bacterium]|nr:DUF1848 domain-containing protein [bacterium]
MPQVLKHNESTLFPENNRQIISASRRTDIPSFYAKWFIERIHKNYVLVRNPFNRNRVKKVSLAPNDVDAIVFWTRDGSPMLPFLDELAKEYDIFFLWTITGYSAPMEQYPVNIEHSIERFQQFSDKIGSDRMALRYDPIIITDEYNPARHIEIFDKISSQSKGYTSRVIVSLMTPYSSALRRMKNAGINLETDLLENRDVRNMLKEIAEIAESNGQRIQACSMGSELAQFGIPDGACIDSDWISKSTGRALSHLKDSGQRKNCLCTKSVDIGAYDTCPRGCVYCYAVKNFANAEKFLKNFDFKSEGLYLVREANR